MSSRPNILLITDDQHRGDCLGLNGHPVVSTPNLDHLGASGANFTRCYSEVPSCIAARRILLSGMDQHATGLVGYRDGLDWDPPQTLPGELSRAGYQTQLVGKIHMWPARKRYGFDHMVWSNGYGGQDDYEAHLLRHGFDEPWARVGHGIDVNGWVARPWHLGERFTHTYWSASESIRFLEQRDTSCPFFLHFSMVDPHPPLTPPEFYLNRYLARELPEPVVGDWAPAVPAGPGQHPSAAQINLDRETMRLCQAAYFGMVNHVDDQVGRVVEVLRRMGLYDNTLILFSSDHGEMLGDHNLFRKSLPYEASARVPLVVKPPRNWQAPSNVVCDRPVGWQDILPTCLDAAGVAIPPAVTGRSLVPFCRGESPATWREAIHIEHSGAGPEHGHALCDGRRKYVWNHATGRELLFDLSTDPDERHNLADDLPAETAGWRERLVDRLAARPEGFVAAGRLVPGQRYTPLIPAG